MVKPWKRLRWLQVLGKLSYLKKVEILYKLFFFCELHHEKTLFFIMDERSGVVFYFLNDIIFYCAEL